MKGDTGIQHIATLSWTLFVLFLSPWALLVEDAGDKTERCALRLQLPWHVSVHFFPPSQNPCPPLHHRHHHATSWLVLCSANTAEFSRVHECIFQHPMAVNIWSCSMKNSSSAALATDHDSWAARRRVSPLPNHGDPSTPFRPRQELLSQVWSEVFASPTSPLAHGLRKPACRNFAARVSISGATTHPC